MSYPSIAPVRRTAQQALYSLPQADYNVISSGNNGYTAGPGYNLVTGLGTPVANLLVPDLIAWNGTANYAGPTVAPLQSAYLVNTGGAANGPSNVINVFSALTVPGLQQCRFLAGGRTNHADGDPGRSRGEPQQHSRGPGRQSSCRRRLANFGPGWTGVRLHGRRLVRAEQPGQRTNRRCTLVGLASRV